MNEYVVYEHVFPNGKKYIGITGQKPVKRWKGGYFGYAHNKYMQNAILKYGWKNIQHNILKTNLSKNEAEEEEIRLISKYDLTNRKNGYNLETGGKCANRIGEETRQKLRLKCSGVNNARYGVEVSKETREKMRKAKLGNVLTEEHKRKISMTEGKKVAQYTKEGEFIQTFHSTREACRQLGIYNVSACALGKKKTAGGYVWKYINDKI